MVGPPRSLKREISPPPHNRRSSQAAPDESPATNAAAVEAGEVQIRDHIQFWCNELSRLTISSRAIRISPRDFRALYARNEKAGGHHFVIHQHDHPVSGVHYDLRLQFSESSSLSFSVPYGLPGNPNSIRPNRMAIETRVHNLWNHLVESASHATGSLLIWDTGEYEIICSPRRWREPQTDDELSDSWTADQHGDRPCSEPEKLVKAFRERRMHIRLHGRRLPSGYTIAMRLPRQNNLSGQPRAPKRRRQKVTIGVQGTTDGDTESEYGVRATTTARTSKEEIVDDSAALKDAAAASDDESREETEREQMRLHNAYPGATNSIGSVHQRQWFLSLDRVSSGFIKADGQAKREQWVRKKDTNGGSYGFDKFFVMGREVESSIVTGRKAQDVMADVGLDRYEGRKMWRPIVH